jgi:hypothetical protein
VNAGGSPRAVPLLPCANITPPILRGLPEMLSYPRELRISSGSASDHACRQEIFSGASIDENCTTS